MTKAVASTSVIDLLQTVKEQLDKLKHIEESVYKTKGVVEPFGNIQNITCESELIKAYSSLRNRKIAYDEAVDDLNLHTVPVFKFDGSTLEEWKHDIELRLSIISQKSTFDELNELKRGYEELMDKEDKLKLLQQKQDKLIKKLNKK